MFFKDYQKLILEDLEHPQLKDPYRNDRGVIPHEDLKDHELEARKKYYQGKLAEYQKHLNDPKTPEHIKKQITTKRTVGVGDMPKHMQYPTDIGHKGYAERSIAHADKVLAQRKSGKPEHDEINIKPRTSMKLKK